MNVNSLNTSRGLLITKAYIVLGVNTIKDDTFAGMSFNKQKLIAGKKIGQTSKTTDSLHII